MRIMIVTVSMDIGGAETHIAEYAAAIKRRGHEVLVVSAGGRLAEGIQANGIPHKRIDFNGSLLCAYRRLLRLTADYRPDVIHGHARRSNLVCACVCKRKRIPFVTTAHWVFDTAFPLKQLTCWGDRCIAVSRDIRRYLTENYSVSPKRIALTVNGINTDTFCPPKTPAPPYHIVHISRLDCDRALTAELLIRMAPALKARFPLLRLTVVGGGTEEGRLRTLAERINKRQGYRFIHMVGAKSNPLPYLQRASLFVGASRAALEALSCDIPVILCGNEGCLGICRTEILKQAELSNFCCRNSAPTTLTELKKHVLDALSDSNAYTFRGREYIQRNYSIDAMTLPIERTLLDAIHDHPPRHVLWVGYAGFGNLGDDLTVKILISKIKAERSISHEVLSYSKGAFAQNDDIRPILRKPLPFLRALCNCDDVVLGNGNLLQSETSLRSLIFYTAMTVLPRLLGKDVYFIGGIGPITSFSGKFAARLSLSVMRRLYCRTSVDYQNVRAFVPARRVHLSADPVFLLPTPAMTARRKGGVLILTAASTSAVPFTKETIKETCEHFQVRFAVLYPQRDLAKACRLAHLAGVSSPISNRNDVFACLAECGICISERLHGVLLALLYGVAAIAPRGNYKIYCLYIDLCETVGKKEAGLLLKLYDDTREIPDLLAQTVKEMPPSSLFGRVRQNYGERAGLACKLFT